MISVLCPSRGHPDLLERSVRSLRARSVGVLEILVAVDDDDIATIEMAAEVADVLTVVPRAGYDRLHVYYQGLARLADGDWLMVWGDDCVMMTDGWDAVIEALPREILVADVTSTHSPLCCFPAVRRAAVSALGMFCTDNPHCDTFWGDIGAMAGVIARVPVYVSAESPVKNQPHDFYSPEHQAKMYRCAEKLRELA
jgi:Glycosyl transferase family 2